MCPSVTKENKGENQRIINQSFHDVTRCVSFYVSKKKNPEKNKKTWGKRKHIALTLSVAMRRKRKAAQKQKNEK